MPKLGKPLDSYGSKLFSGPLGVVQIGFDGYDLGLTSADTILKPDIDFKEILAQQKGTKGYDEVITGCNWMLSATFTEIRTELLAIIAPYLFDNTGSSGADAGVYKANLYESLIDTVSKPLRVAAVQDMLPVETVDSQMNFYVAIPKVSGDFIVWGADTQRNIPVEFKIMPRAILSTESTIYANKTVHGYHGDPSLSDLPATTYVDRNGPYPTAAEVTLATEMTLTMSENMTVIGGVTAEDQIIVNVDGIFVVPTTVAVATNVITLTMPAATFTSGDVVTVTMSAGTVEDGDTNANENVDNYPVVNSL